MTLLSFEVAEMVRGEQPEDPVAFRIPGGTSRHGRMNGTMDGHVNPNIIAIGSNLLISWTPKDAEFQRPLEFLAQTLPKEGETTCTRTGHYPHALDDLETASTTRRFLTFADGIKVDKRPTGDCSGLPTWEETVAAVKARCAVSTDSIEAPATPDEPSEP